MLYKGLYSAYGFTDRIVLSLLDTKGFTRILLDSKVCRITVIMLTFRFFCTDFCENVKNAVQTSLSGPV